MGSDAAALPTPGRGSPGGTADPDPQPRRAWACVSASECVTLFESVTVFEYIFVFECLRI